MTGVCQRNDNEHSNLLCLPRTARHPRARRAAKGKAKTAPPPAKAANPVPPQTKPVKGPRQKINPALLKDLQSPARGGDKYYAEATTEGTAPAQPHTGPVNAFSAGSTDDPAASTGRGLNVFNQGMNGNMTPEQQAGALLGDGGLPTMRE